MTPEFWKEIESVFEAAVELSGAERRAFLDERCGDATPLRNEVEKLLNSDQQAGTFIEVPVWTDSFIDSSVKRDIAGSFGDVNGENRNYLGQRIGQYHLSKEIGRGGMGTVYLGERADGEFVQDVAIKILKRGLDSDFVVRRFRHERQILASFEHPFISRLLDGGTLEDGTPYFVMEYIRNGVSIYDWCDERQLDLASRIKLFLKVCSAIEYAHERLIVHRDIKPGNILINRSGAPKLLDFGIAKILDPDLIHESFHPTASVVRMMTPDYASPEQVRGLEISTSSDIYSLGVLLYELLSGHRPYNVGARELNELSNVICEVDPMPPSQAVGEMATLLSRYENSLDAATVRSSTPEELPIALETLDKIVMTALAKEPGDRFLSISELSQALEPFAKRESFVERVSTSSAPLGPASIRSVAVLPFRTIMFSPGHDTDEHFVGVGLADSLISRLGRIHKFLVVPTSSISRFSNNSVDPIRAGRQLDVDFILDGSIKFAGDRLRLSVQLLDVKSNAAVWAASIDEKAGDIFALEEKLSNQLIEALVPRISSTDLANYSNRGTNSPDAFENYLRGRYHFSFMSEDHLARAFVLFHQAIAIDPQYAHAYSGIANYYNWLGVIGVLPPSECFPPALQAAANAVELDPDLSESHSSLGFSLHVGAFDWKRADSHFRRAIELNPNNANAYLWYSTFLFMSGRFDRGFEYASKAVRLDPLTPYSHYNIGSGLYYARRFKEAEAQHQKVVDEFPEYGLGYYGLSKMHRVLGKTALAVDENEKAAALLGDSTLTKLSRAECLAADGQYDAARCMMDRLRELASVRFVSPYMSAMVYTFLQDYEAALDLLERSVEMGEAWLCCLPVEARFEPVFAHDRFQAILKSINHPLRHFTDAPETEQTVAFSDKTTVLLEADKD